MKEAEYGRNDGHVSVTLNSYLKQLQRKAQVLTELDNKIFALITDPNDLETDLIEAEDTQTHIAETNCTIKNFIENKIESMNTSQQNQASGASSSNQIMKEIINQTASGEIEQAGNQPPTPQEEQSQVEPIQPNTVSENLPAQLNQSTTTNTSVASANHTTSKSSYGMSL